MNSRIRSLVHSVTPQACGHGQLWVAWGTAQCHGVRRAGPRIAGEGAGARHSVAGGPPLLPHPAVPSRPSPSRSGPRLASCSMGAPLRPVALHDGLSPRGLGVVRLGCPESAQLGGCRRPPPSLTCRRPRRPPSGPCGIPPTRLGKCCACGHFGGGLAWERGTVSSLGSPDAPSPRRWLLNPLVHLSPSYVTGNQRQLF